MKTIDPIQLEALFENGKTVELIDVRNQRDFETVHALGARPEPLSEFSPSRVLTTRRLPLGEPLYIMGQQETGAKLAAKELEAGGFQNAVTVRGGIEEWEKNGLPVIREETPGRAHTGQWLIVLLGVVLGVSVHFVFLLLAALLVAGILIDDLMLDTGEVAVKESDLRHPPAPRY